MLTRIRVGRSYLNQHSFIIGLADSPEYLCHFKSESSDHFFLDCFLYSPERQTLFELIEHYIPKFNRFSKKQKIYLILRGINIDDEEYLHVNNRTQEVQNYLISTNRFSSKDSPDLQLIPPLLTIFV